MMDSLQSQILQRYWCMGGQALTDQELLSLILQSTDDEPQLAMAMFQHFGSLRTIIEAEWMDMKAIAGIAPHQFVVLPLAVELMKRYQISFIAKSSVLENSTQTIAYLNLCLAGKKQEIFACLFLDHQYRVIAFRELFYGSLRSARIHPRELIRQVLHFNAAAVIFAHNHPSGCAQPSESDRYVTETLKQTLDLIEVQLLDHIVVAENESISMASLGWI